MLKILLKYEQLLVQAAKQINLYLYYFRRCPIFYFKLEKENKEIRMSTPC